MRRRRRRLGLSSLVTGEIISVSFSERKFIVIMSLFLKTKLIKTIGLLERGREFQDARRRYREGASCPVLSRMLLTLGYISELSVGGAWIS